MLGIADVAACHAGKRVYLGTKLFIYVLNGAPGLAEHCVSLLDACCRNEVHGVTGDLTAHRPRPKVPDALHLATALGCEAGCFVSNDRGFPKVAGIEISVLGV
jgi:hypothetical protein